jgi:hypothetical protein
MTNEHISSPKPAADGPNPEARKMLEAYSEFDREAEKLEEEIQALSDELFPSMGGEVTSPANIASEREGDAEWPRQE